ncbi:hypothetical protein D3C77_641780 [compost metagenome]
MADAGILFEIARVHHVHAAGVGNIVVDQYHFTVLTQIHSTKEHTEQVDLECFHDFDTGITHHAGIGTTEELQATGRIQHQAAVYAPARSGHQRLGDLIHQSTRLPDIKHHLYIMASQLNIADKRFQR